MTEKADIRNPIPNSRAKRPPAEHFVCLGPGASEQTYPKRAFSPFLKIRGTRSVPSRRAAFLARTPHPPPGAWRSSCARCCACGGRRPLPLPSPLPRPCSPPRPLPLPGRGPPPPAVPSWPWLGHVVRWPRGRDVVPVVLATPWGTWSRGDQGGAGRGDLDRGDQGSGGSGRGIRIPGRGGRAGPGGPGPRGEDPPREGDPVPGKGDPGSGPRRGGRGGDLDPDQGEPGGRGIPRAGRVQGERAGRVPCPRRRADQGGTGSRAGRVRHGSDGLATSPAPGRDPGPGSRDPKPGRIPEGGRRTRTAGRVLDRGGRGPGGDQDRRDGERAGIPGERVRAGSGGAVGHVPGPGRPAGSRGGSAPARVARGPGPRAHARGSRPG
jgi:hypothetical protein